MKNFANAILVVFLFCIPIICYLFLDQLYVKRFGDFSQKWYERESPNLTRSQEDLSEILKTYQNVVVVSDLKDFGIATQPKKRDLQLGAVSIERTGFLEYRTEIRVNSSDEHVVFFHFQDDTAFVDFAILIIAMMSIVAIAAFARSRLSQIQEETAQKTTILTIQGMAHDFRAPFGKLRLFMIQLERLDSSLFGRLKHLHDDLDATVDHADDILIDFLSLDAKPTLTPFNCAEIVDRLKTKYAHSWEEDYRHISLQMDCPENIWVVANPRKTLRVLFNLLDNALKHARSRVDLCVQQKGERIVFSIKNDGTQIPDDQIRKIFKPFYSKRKGGLGLGLFLCETFVKSQGGKLRCYSNPNTTEFTFSFPAGSEHVPELKEKTTTVSNTGYKIAYVDDEEFYLNAIISSLKNSAVRVTTFRDTDTLLLALKANPSSFDLLLVDRFGPTFDAVEDRLSESCRDYGYMGPIVLYSNSVTNETKLQGFTRVFDKMKPLSAEDIIAVIEEAKNEKV